MTPLKTVLIIDDDIKFCEGLKLALKMSEINSNIANTPQEALKLVKNNDYYMILVDMFLTPPTLATIKDCPPKCNGIILTKKIKEIKPKIPVIMVSGYKN